MLDVLVQLFNGIDLGDFAATNTASAQQPAPVAAQGAPIISPRAARPSTRGPLLLISLNKVQKLMPPPPDLPTLHIFTRPLVHRC
jgi:hypothetical protein